MTVAFSIDPASGSLRLGDTALLMPHQPRASIEPQVAQFLKGTRDHGNGFAWLHLHDLTFGGQTAALSLCFRGGLFETASWSIDLPDAIAEGGWPTRKAIDDEVSFVRKTLKEMGLRIGRNPWGELWSDFDAKGFMAASGLRYDGA